MWRAADSDSDRDDYDVDIAKSEDADARSVASDDSVWFGGAGSDSDGDELPVRMQHDAPPVFTEEDEEAAAELVRKFYEEQLVRHV